jgi:hypothetical protein
MAIDIDGSTKRGLLAEFVHTIACWGKQSARPQPEKLELAGRSFVRKPNGEYDEVAELREDLEPHTVIPHVIGIESLMAYVQAVESVEAGQGGLIMLSRHGKSCASTPLRARPHEKRDECFMHWYDAYMPPFTTHTSALELRAWLDALGAGRVNDHEAVIAEINTLAAASNSMTKVRQTDAVIQMVGEDKDQVSGALRRRLITNIPIGDPGCEVGIEWLLSAKSSRGELQLSLGAILEPSLDVWAAWARAKVEEIGVPAGWTVLTVA